MGWLQGNTLGSKLVLLSLHFPRLRIIWIRSLHATADLFRALKANQDEPDAAAAALVGKSRALSSLLCPATGKAHSARRCLHMHTFL